MIVVAKVGKFIHRCYSFACKASEKGEIFALFCYFAVLELSLFPFFGAI